MNANEALLKIKHAINNSPRNGYIAELHVQVIKYAEFLSETTGREFCETIGLTPAFGTEFAKMRKIASRLVNAGLDVEKL